MRENVECPSLSPDGTRVAFKKKVGDGVWRLSVLDLETLKETELAETRSVDDQALWQGDRPSSMDWTTPSGRSRRTAPAAPERLVGDAASPAVTG